MRIQPTEIESFGKITKKLMEIGAKFHTYQPKQDRGFRVFLRIHQSLDQNDLKQETDEAGHEVLNIHGMKHGQSKEPLSLFFIDLKPNANNKDIYTKNRGCNLTSIRFEEPHKKRSIQQCTRFKRYGHIRSYCFLKCVKCAQDHSTEQCIKRIGQD